MVWEAEVNELQASYVSLEADVDAHGRLIRPTSDTQAFDAHIWCSAWQLVCFPTGWGWCWAVEEPDCWADSAGTDHDACRIIQTLLSHAFASNVIFDHPLWSIATQPGARYPCGRPDQGAFARLLCALRFCALRNDFVLLSSHVQNLSPVKSLDLWDCEDIQKYRSEHRALKDQVFASITLEG